LARPVDCSDARHMAILALAVVLGVVLLDAHDLVNGVRRR
jgi:hypothetical protein